MLRVETGGMEGKIEAIASQPGANWQTRRYRLSWLRYVASFGSTEGINLLTYAATRDLGAIEAKQ